MLWTTAAPASREKKATLYALNNSGTLILQKKGWRGRQLLVCLASYRLFMP